MKIWIGKYFSDIYYSLRLFDYAITLYQPQYATNFSHTSYISTSNRMQITNEKYIKFILNTLKKANLDKNFYLYFYSDAIAQELIRISPSLDNRILCCNIKQHSWLKSKSYQRLLFKDCVSMLPFALVPAEECKYDILKEKFAKNEQFVIQDNYSSGGHGTFYLDANKVVNDLEHTKAYLVTPYTEGMSCNLHIIVEKNNTIIFPWSYQKVDIKNNDASYLGAHFDRRNILTSKIISLAKNIGKKLRNLGYYGICGIDFLLVNDIPYFIEINCRFQSSSLILDKVLNEKMSLSLYKMHIESFSGHNTSEDLIKDIANMSFDCDYDIIRNKNVNFHNKIIFHEAYGSRFFSQT